MSDDERIEKQDFETRIDLLICMLDKAGQQPGTNGHAEFVSTAIGVLKTKFPQSVSFYANAEQLRLASQKTSKNEFVDPFVLAARIGFAYAFAIVREWQSMTGKCTVASFSQGPQDGSCKG